MRLARNKQAGKANEGACKAKGSSRLAAKAESGDHRGDISSKESIESFFTDVGPFDALVSAAGDARFAPLESLTDEDFAFSLSNKLIGQVNLVRVGLSLVRDNGSFTLTSGLLARYPAPGSAAITLVNAGLEGFARVAAYVESVEGTRTGEILDVRDFR